MKNNIYGRYKFIGKNGEYFTKGKVYPLVRIHKDDTYVFIDDDGDEHPWTKNEVKRQFKKMPPKRTPVLNFYLNSIENHHDQFGNKYDESIMLEYRIYDTFDSITGKTKKPFNPSGLCISNSIGGRRQLKWFEPTFEQKEKLVKEEKSSSYWGSDHRYPKYKEFTTLRQNIVLFIAAMREELD